MLFCASPTYLNLQTDQPPLLPPPPKTHPPQNWGETWLYNEQAIGETVKILEGMALYVKYLTENLKLDNVMMLQLVNEPWVFLDMG